MDHYKNESLLEDLYLNHGIHRELLREMFNVDESTIRYWLKKYDLYEKSNLQYNEQEVVNLYNDGWTMKKIADKIDRSVSCVCQILKRNKVETRPSHTRPKISDEELKRLYIEENLSTLEIEDKVGLTNGNLSNRLRNMEDVEMRGKGSVRRHVSDNKIKTLYVNQGLSSREVGNKVGLDGSTVRARLSKLNIETRDSNYGNNQVTKKGHEVRSSYERQVADFLFENDIEYEYEPKIDGPYIPDFKIGNNIFIEVWGMLGIDDYKHRKEQKMKYYNTEEMNIISIIPTDMNSLKSKFLEVKGEL